MFSTQKEIGKVNLTRWLLSKVVLYVAIFILFFFIGDSLNIIPQNVKDFVREGIDFIKANIILLAFCFCFSVFCWSLTKIFRPSKEKGDQK